MLLDNLEGEAVVIFHPHCSQKGSHGAGCAALPADHLANILRRHAQAQDGAFRLFHHIEYDFTGSIDQGFCDLDD